MAKILFVHTNEALAEMFHQFFFKDHYFRGVTSYQEGREEIKKGEYNLVIVQGSLIEREGDELIKESPAPVVMISGGDEETYQRLAEESGCKAFLSTAWPKLIKAKELFRSFLAANT